MTRPDWQLKSVQRVTRQGSEGILATMVMDGAERELWFLVPGVHAGFLRVSADPVFVAMLAPAIFQGATFRSEVPVSASLLRRARRVEGLLRGWLPDQTFPITIAAASVPDGDATGTPRVATFFAGGVDSFDTAIRNLESPMVGNPRLTHAIHVPAFDGPARRSLPLIREAVTALGLELVLVETNLREIFPMDWEWHRGTALGAVAHALAGGFTDVLIPSTQSYVHQRAAGSYPALDEACSTGFLRLTSDGADAHRAEKIRRTIASSPIALGRLHSCTSGAADHRNCGTCGKCRETMLGLASAGVLGSASGFPSRLPPAFFREWEGLTAEPLEEALAVAKHTGTAMELIRTLESLIPRLRHREAFRGLVEAFGIALRPSSAHRTTTKPHQ